MLKTVFGVEQSPANVSTDTGPLCSIGVKKLKLGERTPGTKGVALLISVKVFLLTGVVGADADPIKRGRARSAPTTTKTARSAKRGRLRKVSGSEGKALVILG